MSEASVQTESACEQLNDSSALQSDILASLKTIRESGSDAAADVPPVFCGNSEQDVGITEFLQRVPGFTGIVKHRWSDFVVREIQPSGDVVELTDAIVPTVAATTATTVTHRPDWFPEHSWSRLLALATGNLDASTDQLLIPVCQLTKEDRTRYHVTVKSAFPQLVSNTVDSDDKKFICVKSKSSQRDKRDTFWKHTPWPRDRPKFLHFCLYKESMDTFSALGMLAMELKMKPNLFNVAGTKDARAKTSQMVSVKQVPAEKLLQAAKKVRNLSVGNFSYKSTPLKLGDLSGNRFSIVLRHVQTDEQTVSARLRHFQQSGFINYYGLQRFGTCSPATHEVGRAILQQRWQQAVDMLLSSQLSAAPGGRGTADRDAMREAQRAWRSQRDAGRAFALLDHRQRRTSVEGRLLHTLSTVRATAYREALDRLPTGTRLIYVHAYQSWIWNRVVSRRLQQHGLQLLVGDLVLLDQQLPEQEAEQVDNGGAGQPLSEVTVLQNTQQLAAHTVDQLVVPLPGWRVQYPQNETGEHLRQILIEDGVQFSREMADSMPQYNTAGAYRRLLSRAGQLQWSIVPYSSPEQDLLESTRPTAAADEPFRALLLHFDLPTSSYATMALRELTGSDSSFATQLRLNELYQQAIAGASDLKNSPPADNQITTLASSCCTQFIDRGGTPSIDRDGTRSIDRDGTQFVDRDGTQSIKRDGAWSIDRDGAQSIDRDGTQFIDRDGTQSIDRDGTQPIDKDGTQSIDRDGTQSIDRDGTQSIDRDGIKSNGSDQPSHIVDAPTAENSCGKTPASYDVNVNQASGVVDVTGKRSATDGVGGANKRSKVQ